MFLIMTLIMTPTSTLNSKPYTPNTDCYSVGEVLSLTPKFVWQIEIQGFRGASCFGRF